MSSLVPRIPSELTVQTPLVVVELVQKKKQLEVSGKRCLIKAALLAQGTQKIQSLSHLHDEISLYIYS